MATDLTHGVNSLFTPASLASLQGAALAVSVASQTLGQLLGDRGNALFRSRAAFLLAEVIALATAASTAAGVSSWKWLIAALNGCMIYLTALGIVNVTAGRATGDGRLRGHDADIGRQAFWVAWPRPF
jgi:hypothetical protein